jgi:hypothetical protein
MVTITFRLKIVPRCSVKTDFQDVLGGRVSGPGYGPHLARIWSSSSLICSSLELSDAKVYVPQIRSLLGTASYFRDVVDLKLKVTSFTSEVGVLSTVTWVNRGSTFSFRRSTLDLCLGGQRSFEKQRGWLCSTSVGFIITYIYTKGRSLISGHLVKPEKKWNPEQNKSTCVVFSLQWKPV